ncbi:MAG: transketolase family protein [Planctomycetes bacterium]|nr:transketolase family protein [Planctomycetota bacterium]
MPTAAAKVATREAYGKALAALGDEREDIIVLDADLSGSTKTAVFKKGHPDRFLNMGVAEANMMGVASGLASTGLTAFASSFAMFAAGKAYEQVRQEIALPRANVKICATHAGLTVGEDGASHQVLEDIALMRVLPNMTVIVPADATETEQAVRAVAELQGPAYVRLSRMATPVLFDPATYRFEIGRIATLREGSDVTIAATGVCVCAALEAAELLERDGISARVLNVACVKPLDVETLVLAAKETAGIVTVEEHQRAAGVGSAVAECVSERAPCPVVRLGVDDRFGESGDGAQLLEHFGLGATHIAAAASDLVGRAQ